jgi:hypothetical protein
MLRPPRRLHLSIVLLALVASLALAPVAVAAERTTDTETFALAEFSGPTSDPRICAEIDLDAYRRPEIPGTAPTTQVVLNGRLFDCDEGPGLRWVSLFGQGGGGFTFLLAKNGKSARLSGTLPVQECDEEVGQEPSCVTNQVQIDLTYRCIAPLERTQSRSRAPDGSFQTTTRSVTCDAEATGSILNRDINLTPAPSDSATIGTIVTRTVRRD